MPGAHAAGQVRVHGAHAALTQRARDAVQLQVHESLRLRRGGGLDAEHVREERKQGHAHPLRVVQVVCVPQGQKVREPGGHLQVGLRGFAANAAAYAGNERREKARSRTISRERETRSRDAGGAHEEGLGRAVSEGFVSCHVVANEARRGGDTAGRSRTRDVQARGPSSRRRRRCFAEASRRFRRTLTTAAGPSGDPRRSFRIATSADATVCGSSASSLSRAMVSRSAASRSSRVGCSPPPIANNGAVEADRVLFVALHFSRESFFSETLFSEGTTLVPRAHDTRTTPRSDRNRPALTYRDNMTATNQPHAGQAIPGLLNDIVTTFVFRSDFLPDTRDLARLRAVSCAMRDAVDATGREVKELKALEAAEIGCISVLERLHQNGFDTEFGHSDDPFGEYDSMDDEEDGFWPFW